MRLPMILTTLCATLALAACDTGRAIYYAEGVNLPPRAADLAQCEALALQDYPIRTEIRFTPRIFVPARQSCTADGDCTLIPGYFKGGEPYTVDANADLRSRAIRGCMGARGYTQLTLPYCEPGTGVQPSLVMAPLTGATCLYRPGDSGEAMVLNPL